MKKETFEENLFNQNGFNYNAINIALYLCALIRFEQEGLFARLYNKMFNNKLLKKKLKEVEVEESLIDSIVQEAVNVALQLHFPTEKLSELRLKYSIAVEVAEFETRKVLQSEIERKRRFLLRMIG